MSVDRHDTSPGTTKKDEQWTPRVEGEEGDPTLFDYLFGGSVVLIVIAGILWAMGYL